MTAPTSNTEPLAAQTLGLYDELCQVAEILGKMDPKKLAEVARNTPPPPGARKYQAKYMSEHRRAP